VILPDHSSSTRTAADEKTIHATLSIKAIAPKVRVFAHVLDRKSKSHLKQANVTYIIISDEFSGLLLMAHVLYPGISQAVITILRYDSDSIMNRLAIPHEYRGRSFKELSDHVKEKGNHIAIALVNTDASQTISDILVDDQSFLDNYIKRKFKEAGRDEFGDQQI
jgi:voltage-gated potassium channel